MIPKHASAPLPELKAELDHSKPLDPGCNLHANCREAIERALAAGRGFPDHCRDKDCEDCFGK